MALSARNSKFQKTERSRIIADGGINLTVVFVGIAAVVNVFVTCDQTTIIAAICDAALGERLCPPGVPSAAAPQFSVVLSEPVVPNPPVI